MTITAWRIERTEDGSIDGLGDEVLYRDEGAALEAAEHAWREWDWLNVVAVSVEDNDPRIADRPDRCYPFREIQTGGGCTALAYAFPDQRSILITRPDDPVVPAWKEPALVGWYDSAGNPLTDLCEYPTLADALVATCAQIGCACHV